MILTTLTPFFSCSSFFFTPLFSLSSPGSTCTASSKIKVLGAGVDVAVNIELESLSGSRLKETYKDFKISAVDIPLKLLPKLVCDYSYHFIRIIHVLFL